MMKANLNSHILEAFEKSTGLLLLLAPPGWGKTSLLLDLFNLKVSKFAFISPLRALAEEFSQRVSEFGRVWTPSSQVEMKKSLLAFSNSSKGVLVLTPELMTENVLSYLEEKKVLTVLDEFHLYHYWGETFRPKMLDALMGLCNANIPLIGLTATFDEKVKLWWKSYSHHNDLKTSIIDLGNQTLLNAPFRINFIGWLSSKNRMKLVLNFSNSKADLKKRNLVFMPYRRQVEVWVRELRKRKKAVLGCVGGEVIEFMEKLNSNPPPDWILSTTCLSHGVNLPNIERVFLLSKIEEKDFYIQMIARGGRNGEPFEVFQVQGDEIPWKTKLLETIKWWSLSQCYFLTKVL